MAKKSLGQNFLIDSKSIAKIANIIKRPCPLLIEIGPGKGALTEQIKLLADKFCFIEKDDELFDRLKNKYSDEPQVFPIHKDFLEFNLNTIWSLTKSPSDQKLTVIGNLPYNISTEILFCFEEYYQRINQLIFMFQKEVALRITSTYGKRSYGILSVLIQNKFQCELCFTLPPGAFRPIPSVDSTVVKFTPRKEPIVKIPPNAEKDFRNFIQACFAHRRKKLANSLQLSSTKVPWCNIETNYLRECLEKMGVDPAIRAEQLQISQFGELFMLLRV